MTGVLRESAFLTTSQEFEKAVEWIRSFHPSANLGRLETYRQNLLMLIDKYNSDEINQLLNPKSYGEIVNTLFEARELILIFRGLSKTSNRGLDKKIKRYIKGPNYIDTEKLDSRNPRDIGFELRIGAHFAAAGYRIDFGNDADLQTEDDGRILFVECKRPVSMNSLERNVKKAFDQLTKRCETQEEGIVKRGIVALSITKLKNPENKILLVKSKEELSRRLANTIRQFASAQKELWERELNIRTIGVIIHLQISAIIEKQSLITTSQQFGWWNRSLPGTIDRMYFDDIVDRLRKSLPILTN